MPNFLTKILATITIVTLGGCGGLGCPLDVPDCCRNVVFGCGPFELPFGCSCSSYGYSATAGAKITAASVFPTQNLWKGSLRQQSSSCLGLEKSIQGNLQLTTSSRRVKITVPGYGVLRGHRRNREYRAVGSYKLFGSCVGRARLKLTAAQQGESFASVAVVYQCGGKSLCSAKYHGALKLPSY